MKRSHFDAANLNFLKNSGKKLNDPAWTVQTAVMRPTTVWNILEKEQLSDVLSVVEWALL